MKERSSLLLRNIRKPNLEILVLKCNAELFWENRGEEYPSLANSAVKLFKPEEILREGKGIRNLSRWQHFSVQCFTSKLGLFESYCPRDARWILLVISCLCLHQCQETSKIVYIFIPPSHLHINFAVSWAIQLQQKQVLVLWLCCYGAV